MSTIHQAGAKALLKNLMASPEWADLINSWSVKLGTGEASWEGFAVYGQPHGRSTGWSLDQLACAVFMHTMVMNGKYAWRTYFLDGERGAHPDIAREANAAALAKLPAPLRAAVDMSQNLADDDGDLAWDAPIEFNRSTLTHVGAEFTAEQIMLPARSVPLEIGSTMPSRTLTHIQMDGGIARWPYGCDYVQVIVDLETRHWSETAGMFGDAGPGATIR